MKPPPPLLQRKAYGAPSAFLAKNLLREARRQKSIPEAPVPAVCVLDPDGDIVRHLLAAGKARKNPNWACYHTDMYDFEYGGRLFGIVGCAVGSPFAVLVAEQAFESGCELLVSVTSSGQVLPQGRPPYFVLIDKALRDEGTSYHYLPPSRYACLQAELCDALRDAFSAVSTRVCVGATWTTDAPFRETERAIEAAREEGILAVEMEAAALYAFAQARGKRVVCFAHVTNQMAVAEGDFEKGEAGGSGDALEVIEAAVKVLTDRGAVQPGAMPRP